MPLRIRRGLVAKADQGDIWLYIAANNMMAADGQIDRLNDAFHMLADYPEAGRLRVEWSGNLRVFPVDHYLIFYRASSTTLEIVRILHAARDVTPEMLSD